MKACPTSLLLTMRQMTLKVLGAMLLFGVTSLSAQAQEQPVGVVEVSYTEVSGIGLEEGVMRRDPSDVIKVGDHFYVWYSKGKIAPGYDATVWFATSSDGIDWTEQGMAIGKGEPGTWEAGSVFTPNILLAENRYWLFYTGTSKKFKMPFNPDSKIGLAVSNSPDGPWERIGIHPVLSNSDNLEDFDSHLVDDACLVVREGRYWLYYKGRQQGKSPKETKMGVAIADKPAGPYLKYAANPVIPGNHEVFVWEQGSGVAAMIGSVGPKKITNSILYADDGLNFEKTFKVANGPVGAGGFRPTKNANGESGIRVNWGVELQYPRSKKDLPFIQRWDAKWPD